MIMISETYAFHTALTSTLTISEGSAVLFDEVLLNEGEGYVLTFLFLVRLSFFTAWKRSSGKVMFSEMFFCPQGDLCLGGLCPRSMSGGGVALSRGLCPGGICPGGLVRGVSVQGGLCPGGFLSRRVSVWGVSVGGGLCPGGSLSGGTLSREVSVWGSLSGGGLCQGVVSVKGVSVKGVSVSDLCLGGSLSKGSLSRGISVGGSLSERLPHIVMGRRYTSYWNAFLFRFCSQIVHFLSLFKL